MAFQALSRIDPRFNEWLRSRPIHGMHYLGSFCSMAWLSWAQVSFLHSRPVPLLAQPESLPYVRSTMESIEWVDTSRSIEQLLLMGENGKGVKVWQTTFPT